MSWKLVRTKGDTKDTAADRAILEDTMLLCVNKMVGLYV